MRPPQPRWNGVSAIEVGVGPMEPGGMIDFSALTEPVAGLRCVIVVPARNEEALLPRALQALRQQHAVAWPHEIMVLANNCDDGTAAAARAIAASNHRAPVHVLEVHWPTTEANVGRARRVLMDEAVNRLERAGADRGVVISTDADTQVSNDWLASNLAAVDAGADAVGGRIVTDDDHTLPDTLQRLKQLDDSYRLLRARLEALVDPDPADPWPRHHQHFGASLAVTAAAYRAVGGLPSVPFLEDEALVRLLRRHDRRVRHCPHVQVSTSARLDGRAAVGLSWQLREWAMRSAADDTPQVCDPTSESERWRLRRRARAMWLASRGSTGEHLPIRGLLTQVAAALNTAGHELENRVALSTSFGGFWEDIEQRLPGLAQIPMVDAVERLQRLISAASTAHAN